MYLINLETSGNQAYIFASNKLRNIIGASELLYRVGTSYVERALKEVSGRDFKVEKITEEIPIEKENSPEFEVIIATSGKALLLAKDREKAKKFITEWSKIIAEEAPGVDAVAVCSENSFEVSGDINEYLKTFKETEREMTLLKMREGSSLARFQRLPIVAECALSGFPASDIYNGQPISEISLAQLKISSDSQTRRRFKALFPGNASEKVLNGLESLEGKDWLAVIHADGNGLGQLFINFADNVKKLNEKLGKEKTTGRDYINYYRNFSSTLDKISWLAFNETVNKIFKDYDTPPIIPIVVGGDDLTVVMDGYDSLKFAESFMTTFCERTENDENIKDILSVDEMKRLGMCAGISIAKPHFPFSQSYSLAEELMKNAKLVKNQYGSEAIALDFHILYDSVATSMTDIREKLKIDNRILTQKPFVIYRNKNEENKEDFEWTVSHDFSQFRLAVEAIKALPATQAHSVRDSLFSEHLKTQEAEWQFLLNTYPSLKDSWDKVKSDLKLYAEIDTGKFSTVFLDALEMKKFLDDKENKSLWNQNF